MEPTWKSIGIERALTSMSEAMGAEPRRTAIRGERCVFGNDGKTHSMEFVDALSRKEFQISGMCQTCQSEFFGRGD